MWGSFVGALKGIGSGLGKAGQWYDQKVGGGLNWLNDRTRGAGDTFVRSMADQYIPGAGAGLQGLQQKARSTVNAQPPQPPQYAPPQQPQAPNMPLPPLAVAPEQEEQNPKEILAQLGAAQQFGKGK